MLNTFGQVPTAEDVVVPSMALMTRFNCQEGQVIIGSQPKGNKGTIAILKFSKFFGSLGQTKNTLWGQFFYVVEDGEGCAKNELPKGMVMGAYLKTTGLQSLNNLIAEILADRKNPASGLFDFEFTKKSGSKANDQGIVSPVNYFTVDWKWRERTEKQLGMIPRYEAALASSSDRLFDFETSRTDDDGVPNLICVDNLSATELAMVMGGNNHFTPQLGGASDDNDDAVLMAQVQAALPSARK